MSTEYLRRRMHLIIRRLQDECKIMRLVQRKRDCGQPEIRTLSIAAAHRLKTVHDNVDSATSGGRSSHSSMKSTCSVVEYMCATETDRQIDRHTHTQTHTQTDRHREMRERESERQRESGGIGLARYVCQFKQTGSQTWADQAIHVDPAAFAKSQPPELGP